MTVKAKKEMYLVAACSISLSMEKSIFVILLPSSGLAVDNQRGRATQFEALAEDEGRMGNYRYTIREGARNDSESHRCASTRKARSHAVAVFTSNCRIANS